MENGCKFSLTKEEKRAFKKFRNSDTTWLSESEWKMLFRKRLVLCVLSPDGEALIPSNGIVQLSDEGKELKEIFRANRFTRRIESVRYWITTIISIAALVLSLIALSK